MYSFFLNHILLPLGSVLFKGSYTKALNEWKDHDRMSIEALENLQAERLEKIIRYAVKNVPYYSQLSLSETSKLEDFPILTKEILRAQSSRLVSNSYSINKLNKNYSSGSSGVQSFTYMTPEHTFYLRALQTHWWKWGGYFPGDCLVQTGISPERSFVKKLKDFFFRVVYVNAFTITPEYIDEVLEKVRYKSPKHIAGYPSAINEIAKSLIQKGKSVEFKSIISYGDKLFDHHIKNFNTAFSSPKIINTYGCAEGYLMACSVDSPYYYVMSPHVYLEIVNEAGQPAKNGEMGNVLVTGLTNYAMPLIRYKLGDLGILLPKEHYPKNRKFNYPMLQKVVGREMDVIKAPNGIILTVHSFTGIFEYYPEIKQFKVLQTQPDKITIEYILDTDNPISEEIKNRLLVALNAITQNSILFTFKKVDKITASPSGKPQIIEILF